MEENGSEAATAAAVSSFVGILMSIAGAHIMRLCVFNFRINLIINSNLFCFLFCKMRKRVHSKNGWICKFSGGMNEMVKTIETPGDTEKINHITN